MGFFIVLMFLPIALVMLVLFMCMVFILVAVGSGVTALAAGGLASTRLIKDRLARNLTVQTCCAILLFGAACFAFLAIMFSVGSYLVPAVIGCVLGCATLVLSISGLVRSLKLSRTKQKVLFIVLFSLVACMGVFALGIFGVSTVLALL